MRICIEKSTGKIIEMQSGATRGTLLINAANAGYAESDIEEREVTDVEYTVLLAEQPKSKDETNAQILSQITAIEFSLLRPLRELNSSLVTDKTFAQARVDSIEQQIQDLRAQLK